MKPVRGVLPPRVLQQVSILHRIETALQDCLPAECCVHCRAAKLENGTLCLVADSAAWRARLHFHSARIIRHFNRLGKFPVERIRVRVGRLAEADAPRKSRAAPRPIPPVTARALAQLAEETDDPGLRRALKRLAEHGGTGDPAAD